MKKKFSLVISLLAALTLSSCNFLSPSSSKASNKDDKSSVAPGPGSDSAAPGSDSVDPGSDSGDQSGDISVDDTSSSEDISSSEQQGAGNDKYPATGGWEDPKTYTFKDFLTVCPSNWNELTYQDNNDTEIMGYIGGSFFRFNYKFDENGNIKPGEFEVEFDAVDDIEDVTLDYVGSTEFVNDIPANADSGYAYKFTLRNDLKWDDGTPIKAADFVYTMQQQEDPLFQNYRADSYYNGATVIHNAMNYVKQGQSGYFQAKEVYKGVYNEADDANLIFHCTVPLEDADPYDGAMSYIVSYLGNYLDYIASNGIAWLINSGLGWGCPLAQAQFDALEGKSLAAIKADATLKSYWDALIGWWQTDPGEELDFFVANYTYPDMTFDKVGIFQGDNDLELVVVLDSALPLLNDDGSLSYHAAYEFGSLPVVKRDLYEANKKAPTTDGGLWTTTYNTSLESTASWGPYKLSEFQAGKGYTLIRNNQWYGYNMDEYADQYQTDIIDVEVIANWSTAFLKFQEGDIQSINIDVSVSDQYKNSERAVFTASDFVGSMQLQSDVAKIAERSDAEHNKMLLKYVEFRKALSLAVDRADYNDKCTTASLAGFGLFNSMHYYDVANGGVYRNTDVAKKVICEVYGVNVNAYDSLEEAYNAVTGYNLELARELLTEAYNKAKAAGEITDTDKVVLTLGTAEDTISTRRVFDYLNATFQNLAVGTPLEGRLELEFDTHWGTKWADDFRSGLYDICTGGWTGAAWNPGYFLLAYLSPDYMYSRGWDTSKAMLTFNPYQDGNDDHIYTMSLIEWYNCLNGKSGAPHNWADGKVDTEVRLNIIGALEAEILKVYYTVPISYSFSAGLVSYKIEYISRTYNTFMSYGGIRYIRYVYDDEAWETVKGTFDYTK